MNGMNPLCRRWFRFRLRTLLILVAIPALPLAWIAKERGQSRHEAQVAEQLRRHYDVVMLAGPYDSWHVMARKTPQGAWKDLAHRVIGERIIHIAMPSRDFDDIPLLVGLTNVQWLHLQGTKAQDLAFVAGYRHLIGLDASGTVVSDLTPLTELKDLQGLWLNKTKVSDLTPIAGLRKLQGLHLQSTLVSDVAPLAGHVGLTELDLQDTPVTREQVEDLRKSLPNCKIRLSYFD
jgi:hypothetical protein